MKIIQNEERTAMLIKQTDEKKTFKEIAELTGLNPQTVSRVIKNNQDTIVRDHVADKLTAWLNGDL